MENGNKLLMRYRKDPDVSINASRGSSYVYLRVIYMQHVIAKNRYHRGVIF